MKEGSKKSSTGTGAKKEQKLRDLKVKKAAMIKAGRVKDGVIPFAE